MLNVLHAIARFLTRRSVFYQPATHAGPTFEYYWFDSTRDARGELLDLCGAVVDDHRELVGVSRVIEQAGG